MIAQPDPQTVARHILPNISGSKGNQSNLKFGQLIEYNQRYVFLQISCRKWERETFVELFSDWLWSTL